MMKKIGIIGLGLIGGSMAKTISSAEKYEIYGTDERKSVITLAIEEGVLKGELNFENACECDLLIVALYPKDVVRVINEYVPYLKKGTVVVDCTGIKQAVCNGLSKDLNGRDIFFIGGHPMAGKEVSGYANADDMMFKKASMILCRDKYTNEEAFEETAEFFRNIGFKSIKETTPEEHDRVIAYTSQMAHVVSSSYIKSPTLEKRYGFSAGSFKDMTRVALLNEYMWTDLFLDNKDALVEELDIFIGNMKEIRDAIDSGDKEKVCRLLKRGRELKISDEEREANAKGNS